MTSRTHDPKPCACGCGALVKTKGAAFRPGHFARVLDVPVRMCPAPGCLSRSQSQRAWSRNLYCQFHQTRLRDTGDLVLQARPSTWDRFVDRVIVAVDDCWLWLGSGGGRNAEYGQFWFGGTNGLAHRYAYETLVGPIPEEYEIDHLCRVKKCVNPAHLEAVTPAINVQRAFAATKGATS